MHAGALRHRHAVTPYDGVVLRGSVTQTWLAGRLTLRAGGPAGMRLLVLNPNTSESMTAEIAAAARAVAADGTEIVARSPRFGATAIDSAAESLPVRGGCDGPGGNDARRR